MAEKRYYWLKLKEDYFNSPKIKKLRKIAGGDTYTIIYLKMQLLSIKNGGVIQFENIEPTLEEELALKLDEDVENVKITLAFLQAQSLMEMNNNNEYLLLEASNNIGSEGQSAERQRRFQERKKQEALENNGDVTEHKRNYISISNSISNNINNNIINNNKENILKESKELEQTKDFSNQADTTNPSNTFNANKEIVGSSNQTCITNDKVITIFDFWNSKNIVKHKTLSDVTNKSILKALKQYSVEQIKEYISRYKIVIDDKKYFFDYIWTLAEFLSRKNGISSFADDGSKWLDYCQKTNYTNKVVNVEKESVKASPKIL